MTPFAACHRPEAALQSLDEVRLLLRNAPDPAERKGPAPAGPVKELAATPGFSQDLVRRQVA